MITVTTFALCLALALTPAPYALGSHASSSCCTTHSRTPVPPQLIRGYREQTAKENCRIEAIIDPFRKISPEQIGRSIGRVSLPGRFEKRRFYTVQRKMVCATPKDEWVKKVLKVLSSKLRRISRGKP